MEMVLKQYYNTPVKTSGTIFLDKTQVIDWNKYAGSWSGRNYKSALQVSNPAWRSQLGRGNATTPRSVTIEKVTYTPGQHTAFGMVKGETNAYISGSKGLCYNPILPTSAGTLDLSSVRSRAASDFLQRLKKTSNSVSAGVFIGELGETIRMLMNPAQGIYKAFHNYNSAVLYRVSGAKVRGLNQHKKSKLIQQAISDSWLELQYGIMPLITDIEGITKAINRLILQPEITQVSSKTTDSKTISPSFRVISTPFSCGNIPFRVLEKCESTVTIYSKAGLVPQVEHGAIEEFGLGLTDFAPTLWNLIPYSFVADYFFNINQLVSSAFVATDRVIYYSKSEVIETTSESRTSCDMNPLNSWKIQGGIVNQPGLIKLENKTIVRTNTISYPTMTFRTPTFKQMLNLSALFASGQSTSYKLRGV